MGIFNWKSVLTVTSTPRAAMLGGICLFCSVVVAQQPASQPTTDAAAKKAKQAELAAKEKDAFKGVFYANDFSYLDDPAYQGDNLGDSFKRLAGGRVDLGGEARVRYHRENNIRGLGLTGKDDEFWLSRVRTFSNWRITDDLRFYGEYLYADSAGEQFAPRAIEENHGEAQNLFLDAKLFEADGGKLTARVGRQELLFGNQRLVSPLDWGNTRRTFDGYRLLFSGDSWDIDGFYTNPVKRTPEYVNKWDSADDNQKFYGLYSTRKGLDIGVLGFIYYLAYENSTTNFNFLPDARQSCRWRERLVVRTGRWLAIWKELRWLGPSRPGFFTSGLGRKLSLWNGWSPTLWGWYDYASGGKTVPASRGDDSFDHLFPLPADRYNGFMDLFGRRNLHDLNAQFITPLPGKKVSMTLWYHYFLLDQKTTPYSVVMTPYNAANAAGSRELGHELDVLFSADLNTRNNVLVGYSFFAAGDYYRTTPGVE